jgi:Tol biopolymer transport system component
VASRANEWLLAVSDWESMMLRNLYTFASFLVLGASALPAPTGAPSVDVSPDGRRIVFTRDGGLYTMSIDGGQAKRLADPSSTDGYARWSPDGRRIAFACLRSNFDNVCIADVATSRITALTHDSLTRRITSVDWSDEGEAVAVAFGESAQGFDIVSADGSGRQSFTVEPIGRTGTRGITRLVFAHDRRSVLLQRASPGTPARLYRYDPRLRDERQITEGAASAILPRATGDGRRLFFIESDSPTRARLVLRDIQAATQRVVSSMTGDRARVTDLSVSRDGKTVVLTAADTLWSVNVSSGKWQALASGVK